MLPPGNLALLYSTTSSSMFRSCCLFLFLVTLTHHWELGFTKKPVAVGLEGISHRKSPNSEPTKRVYVFTLYLELCFLVMTSPCYEPAAIEWSGNITLPEDVKTFKSSSTTYLLVKIVELLKLFLVQNIIPTSFQASFSVRINKK